MWPLAALAFLGVAVQFLPSLPFAHANNNLRTLRTFHTHACDGDDLLIECWPNTVISITRAVYGKPAQGDQQCSVFSDQSHLKLNQSVIPQCTINHPVKAIQEMCEKKSECSIEVSSKLAKKDMCPGVVKYAEVSFKCRPSNLLTKIVCKGEVLKLRCPKTLRIVIYNAWYGSSHVGVPECPQQRRHKSEDCKAEYATETVMDVCHGKLKCSFRADSDTFGETGCTKKAHMYLKVVYTCVSKDILQDLELDKQLDGLDYSTYFDESQLSFATHDSKRSNGFPTTIDSHDSDDFLEFSVTATKEVEILSDENSSDVSTDVNCTAADKDQRVIGFITEWIAAYKFISDNKEKFILYLTVSLGAGLLAFLIVLAARLFVLQKKQSKMAKLDISDPLPLTLDEDCSDLDQYDPRRDRSVEVVRYTNTSTVRRQDSDSGPRAPLSHSMNNYYYS